MLKRFFNSLFALKLYLGVTLTKIKHLTWRNVPIKKKKDTRQQFEEKQRARYLAQSLLKAGDQYKLGEATITLAKFGIEGKLEVAAKIKAAKLRREAKLKAQTEKGIEMMLMSPEKLSKSVIEDWLQKRKNFSEAFKKFNGKFVDDITACTEQPAHFKQSPNPNSDVSNE